MTMTVEEEEEKKAFDAKTNLRVDAPVFMPNPNQIMPHHLNAKRNQFQNVFGSKLTTISEAASPHTMEEIEEEYENEQILQNGTKEFHTFDDAFSIKNMN